MAHSFHYKIEITDDRGVSRLREFIVIAGDEGEAHQELAEIFAIHDVIGTWRIAEVHRDSGERPKEEMESACCPLNSEGSMQEESGQKYLLGQKNKEIV